MNSLRTAKRSPRVVLVFIGICFVMFLALVLLITQSRNVRVDNVPQFLSLKSVPSKPSVVSAVSQQSIVASPVLSTAAARSTGAEVRQVATAQSQSVASKVSYPSTRITPGQRDRLLIIASSVGIIGVSLYVMTLLSVVSSVPPVTRRPLYNANAMDS